MDTAKVAERIGRQEYRWIGRGLYTPAEASRVTGISAGRIRRWLLGYAFVRRGERRNSPPVLHPELESGEDDTIILTFRDLIEVMCVHGFLEAGVKWPLLRRAHEQAFKILKLDHPFATQKFLTDGHSVLIRVGEQSLLDVVSNQYALVKILSPQLKTDRIDFDGAFAQRWWPMGRRQPVVVDAGRSFGQPIVQEGVPTLTLYRAYVAENRSVSDDGTPYSPHNNQHPLQEKTISSIATWYAISVRSVRAAIEYELRLAA